MLPKKRKFTPTEYQTWIPEPPEAHQSSVNQSSSRSQEDNEVAINLGRLQTCSTQLRLTQKHVFIKKKIHNFYAIITKLGQNELLMST